MTNKVKGQLVIVRAFQGRFQISRVWDIGENVVYITNEDNYRRLISGEQGAVPIGFPKQDIFVYDPELVKNIDSNIDWESLTQWS